MRTNQKIIRLSDSELAIIEAAAAASHPTAKGGNVARMIREAAMSDAMLTLWGTLDALADAMRAGDARLPEWDSLPTYGGDTPACTLGVWSWDADRVLVGDCADELTIWNRDDWSE